MLETELTGATPPTIPEHSTLDIEHEQHDDHSNENEYRQQSDSTPADESGASPSDSTAAAGTAHYR